MDLSNIIFIYCLLMCVVTREGLGTANRIRSLLLSGESWNQTLVFGLVILRVILLPMTPYF